MDHLWALLRPGQPPPPELRFYANGLFVATRERIRARPRAFYIDLAERLAGARPSLCDVPDTRGRKSRDKVRKVGDCHLLEKLWHVVMGEEPLLPQGRRYDAARVGEARLRAGSAAPRSGSRLLDVGHMRCYDGWDNETAAPFSASWINRYSLLPSRKPKLPQHT